MPAAIGRVLAWAAMLALGTRIGMAVYWASVDQPIIVAVQLSQAGGLALMAWLWFRQPPRALDRAVVLLSGWLLLGGLLSDLQLAPDATRVLRFLMILTVTTFFVESGRWLIVLLGIGAITWGIPTLRGLDETNAPTVVMGAVVASLAAAVLHLARRRIVALEAAAQGRQDALEVEVARRERLQAEVAADRKRESLTLMSAGVAHDLNNLLGPMLACTRSAWDGADRQARQDLDIVLSACEDARALCEGLLDHTGETVRATADLGILAFFTANRGLFERCSPAVGLAIDAEALSRDVAVSMSASALRRLIVNLVTNAAQATPEGGAPVEVVLGPIHEDRTCTIEVRDRGCGIPVADLDRIFDPFYSTRRRGRGLGLSSVQGIVRAHAGTVDVESALGEGTRMRVTLPISAPKEESARAD
ncbi:MAG: HAMP domain-containing sensor histidine kinase [Myxococcota bacterium]